MNMNVILILKISYPRESYQRECNPFYSKNSNKTLTETQIVRETLW